MEENKVNETANEVVNETVNEEVKAAVNEGEVQNVNETDAAAEETKIANEKLEELKKEINTLHGKQTTLEKEKEELVKKADDLIAKTIYEKKREIENTYSEVLTEAEKRLKVSEAEKEKERKKNLDSLVDKNTRPVRENNVYLKNEIKRILKDNKMPGFVNSNFYLSLWSPSNFGQFLVGLIVMLIVLSIPTALCFVVFKNDIAEMFPNNIVRIIVIAFIYLAFVFLFGGIWLLVDKWTKKNPEALKQVKELRKNIADNNKEIEKITKNTGKEMTDSQFDYTKLDREIEAGKIEVDNYKAKREEAVNNFANTTQVEITNKIKAEAQVEIDKKEAEIEAVKLEVANTQKQYDDLKLSICDNKVAKV